MSPFTAEIVGTMMLILLGNGIVANMVLRETKGQNGGWIIITLGWGLSVFTAVLISMDYSGAHLNPAVTIGLAMTGNFAWDQVISYIIAQLIGAAIGALLVWVVYSDHYKVTDDQPGKLATFATIPAIRNPIHNVIAEMIGTFVLVFTVLFISGPNFVSADPSVPAGLGSLGALPVGLLVAVIGMGLGGPTGFAINPARDLAPRFMHWILPVKGKGDSDWGYAWIPVISPVLGAALAAGLFALLN